MSDDPQVPGEFETAAQRRERISLQVRRWSEDAWVDARLPVLSDEAAVLIAAGHLDSATREILAERRRTGRTIPSIGGFGALRRLTDEQARLAGRAAELRPGPVQAVFTFRAAEVAKRLAHLRAALVLSATHYASGVRAIRRERRDGVHLEPDQREALFAALQRTPVPVTSGERPVDQVRNATLGAAAERVAALTESTPLAGVGRRAAEALAQGAAPEGERFADRYDTLLYLAGTLYDRIDGSSAWHSEHFLIQRAQLDLADELIQIAADTVALRGITAELAAAMQSTRGEGARAQITARQTALAPVWGQLVDRVAALARIGDLLSQAEDQLQTIAAVQRTMSLDSRIDDLIARSGNRELSAENTHHVGDQFGGVEELMGTYQSVLYGDILALTSRADPGRGRD
ncbi:hypothetical protein [Rhodococcus sp. UNC363MFTsu5.1]|uniref:hypothetical protein n=1 Tax=Rhodococcus sp. UNC363MFTsu5.1 TaxID=1449069 RepID=UPI0004846E5F|nr:hypothetical protein [Rhodococcus sp. UNC363MFTsu5.1]